MSRRAVAMQLDSALLPFAIARRSVHLEQVTEEPFNAINMQAGVVAAAKFVVCQPLKPVFMLWILLAQHDQPESHAQPGMGKGAVGFITPRLIVKMSGNAR